MLNITVIILTFNEEIHIRRCIENIKDIVKEVIVVDSFSTDNTCAIAESLGTRVVQHKWSGTQAAQFNWALQQLKITSEWILRLDADEYLLPELKNELENKLPSISSDVSGIILKRRHYFLGKWIKHGIYPVRILRLFRTGKGICEQRLMDEHIVVTEGSVVELKNDFVDCNLQDLNWFCSKHLNYAIREAAQTIQAELQSRELKTSSVKAKQKKLYNGLPLFFRAWFYFMYRYIIRLGFLDGKEGFIFNFLQAYWYRTLVDIQIFVIKKECGTDVDKFTYYMKEKYNLELFN